MRRHRDRLLQIPSQPLNPVLRSEDEGASPACPPGEKLCGILGACGKEILQFFVDEKYILRLTYCPFFDQTPGEMADLGTYETGGDRIKSGDFNDVEILSTSGGNSAVECQLPEPDIVG
ncbi:MAG: hypothetical protein ACRD1O_07970 [Terriglobia bacterium]